MDKYSYINDPPRKRLAKSVILGTGAGAFCGVIYLWAFHPSWNELLASILAGGVAGLLLGIVAAFPWKTPRIIMFCVSPLAGAAGGLAWSAIAQPATSGLVSAIIGAIVLVVFLVLAELGLNV